MPSFTAQIPDLAMTGPVLEVILSLPVYAQKSKVAAVSPIKMMAMIDTGATGTVITKEVVEQLGIMPVSTVKMSTPSSQDVECYVYPVRLLIPQHKLEINTTVIAAPLQGQHIQCLIGRDILKNCVFHYIGYVNQFTLSI
jgi:predicted aspartyl protease